MKNYILSSKYKKIHFTGVGGVSMSALAKHLLSCKKIVSGSDTSVSASTEELKRLGAKIFKGHESVDLNGVDALVYTSAIKDDNPELILAKSKNIPLIKRSELLGEILEHYPRSVCVGGSHGKTTVTAMISQVLIDAGFDPTVFLGGEHYDFSNYRLGGGKIAVAEACEYKRNFLDLTPCIAVVLNTDYDHPDTYADKTDIVNAFRQFIGESLAVINADDQNADALFNSATVTFGVEKSATYTARNIKEKDGAYSFTAYAFNGKLGRINLKQNGFHYLKNAIATVAVCDLLGVPFDKIKTGIENYKGVKRRGEFLGERNGKKYYADYAHHPSEIVTVLGATDLKKEKVGVIFQPHTYSRTKSLMKEFVSALKNVSPLILYKTYPAREDFDERADALALYGEIGSVSNGKIFYSGSVNQTFSTIDKEFIDCEKVLVLGAGDLYDKIKSRLN